MSRRDLPAPHPVDRLLEALGETGTGTEDLAHVVELAARVCGSGAAALTLRRGEAFHVPVTVGFDPLVCSTRDAPCQHGMRSPDIFVMEDARTDVRTPARGWFAGRSGDVGFYASAPIHGPDGVMLGRLLVLDREPRSLTQEQSHVLALVADTVSRLLGLRLLRSRETTREHEVEQVIQEQSHAVVDRLAAELSHDLRAPLSAVVASLEMLQDAVREHNDVDVAVLLGGMKRAADRMMRMLEHRMDHATHPAGEASYDEEPLHAADLGSVARQLVLDFEPVLEPAGVTVQIGPLPVVDADPDEMYSVLQNLLTNAVKYARPGIAPLVAVEGRRVGDFWRVSVSDNGIGIPEDRRVDVFSLGSRAGLADDRAAIDGHGIGLATVARIVHLYGGAVGVEEAPGGGAEMWFELPA